MWQAEVRIDLDAIRDNVAMLRASTTAELMAVVDADLLRARHAAVCPRGPGRRTTGDDPVAPGDVATLFGPQRPTADDWAAAIATINYEIVTRFGGSRVPRVYDGEV